MDKTSVPGLFAACRWVVVCLVFALAGKSLAVDANNPNASRTPSTANTPDYPAGERTRLTELNLLSGALVEKAETGSSPAHDFRIEARMYRELLRQLMLDNRLLPETDQIRQDVLLEMVRMSALLHSAADCKTGLVITCPPDLMRQLKSQQTRIDQELQLNQLLLE